VDRRNLFAGLMWGSLASSSAAAAASAPSRKHAPTDLARLATVEAREDIKELTARYCWFAARGDAAGIAGLYAADGGAFDIPIDGARRRFVGRDAIRAFLEKAAPPNLVHPLVSNHILQIHGSTAVGTCDMHNLSHPGDGSFVHTAGYYEDRYVFDRGAWYFKARSWFPLVSTGG
jgi:hypothetical protein